MLAFLSVDWGLGVPAPDASRHPTSVATFGQYWDRRWIVNSRNTTDEEVVRTLASMA